MLFEGLKSRYAMTDFAAARRMMVDGQVRTADVTDLRVLHAFQTVARERFVSPANAAIAYLDRDVPADDAGARRLLKPMVLAKLIQAADIQPTDRVLDVGCASGYSTAILADLAAEVVAVEEDPALAQRASAALIGLSHVKVVTGPLADGWSVAAPYDVILVNGAVGMFPDTLCRQLKDGGRLACVVGTGPGKATLYRRGGREVGSRAVFDAEAPTLPGFSKPLVFAF